MAVPGVKIFGFYILAKVLDISQIVSDDILCLKLKYYLSVKDIRKTIHIEKQVGHYQPRPHCCGLDQGGLCTVYSMIPNWTYLDDCVQGGWNCSIFKTSLLAPQKFSSKNVQILFQKFDTTTFWGILPSLSPKWSPLTVIWQSPLIKNQAILNSFSSS